MAPKQSSRMRVVTLASTKGGAGQDDHCSALAVRAAEEASAWRCWISIRRRAWPAGGRGAAGPRTPSCSKSTPPTEAIELLLSEGWQWAFIDTGPAKLDLIEPGIAVADLVLIPTRPSAFDIEQAAIIRRAVRGATASLTPSSSTTAPPGKLTKSSIEFLQQNGSTVIEPPITIPARPSWRP